MRRILHPLFWSLFAGFVVLASRVERAEAAVCSTAGAGPVCGYSYDVKCEYRTFECEPIIYELREYVDRPISGPTPT